MRLFQALPLVVLLASGTALADFPSGEAAYKGKDYGSAFSLLKPDAGASNAQAQYYLGVMLRRGDGVQKDASAAANWFLKAAEQGHPEAQSTIAALYRLGEGVPQDYSKAMHWYLEAARQGFENAQYRIALMYRDGQGSPENIAEAYKWAYMSAMQSQPEPVRLRDKLAKQLSAAQIQSAHQEAATFLADVPARKAEAKKRLEASLSPVPQPAASPEMPSNNSCSQAATPIDALKCLDPELVKLDTEVAQLYRDGLTTTKGVGRNAFIQLHRQWSAKLADACGATMGDIGSKTQASGKITCVKDLYVARIEEMSISPDEEKDAKAEEASPKSSMPPSAKTAEESSRKPVSDSAMVEVNPIQNAAQTEKENFLKAVRCSGFLSGVGLQADKSKMPEFVKMMLVLTVQMNVISEKYGLSSDDVSRISQDGAEEFDRLKQNKNLYNIEQMNKSCSSAMIEYDKIVEKLKVSGEHDRLWKEAIRKKEEEETYDVIVSCEMWGENVVAAYCFTNSTLDINSGMNSEVYREIDLLQKPNRKDGLHLSVKAPFLITGRNTGKDMTLRIKIVDSAGKVTFNKAVGDYGTIKVKDK